MNTIASLALAAGIAHAHSIDHADVRQAFVDEINALATTWTAAVHPRFKGLPLGAFTPMLGVKQNNREVMAAMIAAGEMVVSDYVRNDIPDSFDSAENWPQCASIINDIRDQSNCGCCWAFSAVEAATDRMCIASNGELNMPLSAEDVCFNSNWAGCNGGQPAAAWQFIRRTGVVTGGQYGSKEGYCSNYALPHCHHHGPQGNDPYPAEGQPGCPSQTSPRGPKECDSTASSSHADFRADKYSFKGTVTSFTNERAIQTAIMTDGPVSSAFTVYDDFENYAGGIYQHTTGNFAGGHAIKIVGWGEENGVKYWKVANSWNPWWGEKGYFRIARGQDECSIESQAVASSSGATFGKKH